MSGFVGGAVVEEARTDAAAADETLRAVEHLAARILLRGQRLTDREIVWFVLQRQAAARHLADADGELELERPA